MDDSNQRYSLLYQELAKEEARLKHLDNERKTTLANIQRIRNQLAAPKPPASQNLPTHTLSSEAKIALFRTLFKGREDLYPKL